jgi:hypothetical protein
MRLSAHGIVANMLDRWYAADAMDFGALALTIIVMAWFIARYYGE